jgi:hypothetical protein
LAWVAGPIPGAAVTAAFAADLGRGTFNLAVKVRRVLGGRP